MKRIKKSNLSQMNFLDLLYSEEEQHETRSTPLSSEQQTVVHPRVEGMEQMELEQSRTDGLHDEIQTVRLITGSNNSSGQGTNLDSGQLGFERSGNGGSYGNQHDTSLETERSISTPRTNSITNKEVFSIADTSYLYLSKKEKIQNNILALKTLKELEASNSVATKEQQTILSKYVGFGGIAEVFTDKEDYLELQTELKSLVTPQEYNDLRDSTSDTFFTNEIVVKGIYDILDTAGFGSKKDLKILEPACGTGNFMGFMPKNILENAKTIHGIELNSISAKIAQHLYSSNKIEIINKPFQEINLIEDKYDVIIGNFPFGSQKIYDQYSSFGSGKSLHNYFLAKSLESLNDKGILVAVTSSHFLNATNNSFKKEIDKVADFIGSIRLPREAFNSANTETITDIIILQKNNNKDLEYLKDLHANPEYWVNSDYKEGNDFYNNNLDKSKIIGKAFVDTNQFGEKFINLSATPERIANSLPNIISEIVLDDLASKLTINQEKPTDYFLNTVPNNIFIGEYFINNGQIAQRIENGMLGSRAIIINDLNDKEKAKLKAVILLKEKTKDVLEAEINNLDIKELIELKKELIVDYSSFVESFGSLDSNKKSILADVRGRLVLNLEKKDKNGNITLADIFHKKIINNNKLEIKNLNDAVYYSNFTYGKINLDYIANLKELEFNGDQSAVIKQLEFNSLAYYNPKFELWEITEKYLSGNILEKLEDIKNNPSELNLTRNIKALNRIMPKAIPFQEIGFSLNTSWIPLEYKREFVEHLMEIGKALSAFNYEPVSDNYDIKFNKYLLLPALNSMKYGTERMPFDSIVTNILKNKETAVYDTKVEFVNDKRREIKVLNPNETNLALEKQALIEAEFFNFISKDPLKLKEVEHIYNNTFNTFVTPSYKANKDIILPNSNPDIKLYEHQRKAVLRGILEDRYLLDHVVGAGKTYTMIATAMERKRLGFCKKPMIIVPNHLVGQWRRAFTDLYPNSNVLTADEQNFTKDKRENFVSNMALNQWDCIIMSHSSFEKIPLSPDIIKQKIMEELDTVNTILDNSTSITAIKQLKKVKEAYHSKLEKLADNVTKDSTLYFNNLGVDELYVDEAHEFKNLQFHTKGGGIKGISPAGSNKAYDLFLKKEYIQEQKQGSNHGLFLATGTPLSNSLAELYTISRYMDNSKLNDLNINHFDCWASVFANITDEWQVSNTGAGFSKVRMFSSFKNIPELAKMYSQYADLVRLEDLKGVVKIPKIEHGKPQNILAEPTAEQRKYMQDLISRMGKIKGGSVNPKDDNALKVCNDGRSSALDLRLKDISAEPSNKIGLATNNIMDLYHKYNDDKGTQLVFCDLSTPKNKDDFSIYYDLKSRLVDSGIKENEVAFIHSYDTDEKKVKLFEAVNKGDIRVLIGSSIKMGAGMNVQQRLVGLHHLDAPWRPTDLEQREGRIIRQGNKLLEKYGENFEVSINRYATENMYDSRLWQILENKAKFIQQFRAGNIKLRTGEDISENEIKSVEEMKAVASGNPYFLLYLKLKEEHHKQEVSYKRQVSNITKLKGEIADFEQGTNPVYNDLIQKINKYEACLNNQAPKKYVFNSFKSANNQYIIEEENTSIILYSSNIEPTEQIYKNRTEQGRIDRILSSELINLKEQKTNIEKNISSAKESVLIPANNTKAKSLEKDVEDCKKVLEEFNTSKSYWTPKTRGFEKEVEAINKYFGKNNINQDHTIEISR